MRKSFKKIDNNVYPKQLTLRYTVHILNFYTSYSFFNVRLTYYFFSFKNIKYFNTHFLLKFVQACRSNQCTDIDVFGKLAGNIQE